MSIISIIIASTLFLPRTNERTLTVSPLAEGEVVHEVISEIGTTTERGKRKVLGVENASKLWVGGEGGAALPVVDGSALRGYKIVTIDRGDYSIAYDSGIVYNSSNDTWSAVNAEIGEHRIIVTCASQVDIHQFLFDQTIDTIAEISPEYIGDIKSTFTNNIAVITMTKKNSGEAGRKFEVRNIVVKRIGFGSASHVTDLRTHIFQLRDDIGDFTFGGLRDWVTHLYDGNRGEDWSQYDAANTLHMRGETLTLDKRNRYSFVSDDDATNVVLKAGGRNAVELYSAGTGVGYEGCFTFTDYEWTTNCATIRFTHDIDGFNYANLSVQTNSVCGTNGWATVADADIVTKTNGLIVINGNFNRKDSRFFRLNYNGIVSSAWRMTVRAPLYIEGELYMRGTDAKLYRITVDAQGVHATEINE